MIFPERDNPGSKPLGANLKTEAKEPPKAAKPEAATAPRAAAPAEAEGEGDLF